MAVSCGPVPTATRSAAPDARSMIETSADCWLATSTMPGRMRKLSLAWRDATADAAVCEALEVARQAEATTARATIAGSRRRAARMRVIGGRRLRGPEAGAPSTMHERCGVAVT